MNYFTTKRSLFLFPSNKCAEELEKIDKFLEILEISQVSKIINNVYKNDNTTILGRISDFINTYIVPFKQNMQYTRIKRHGLEKVSCEIMLMCLGSNIRKYFSTLNGKKLKSNYWNIPQNLKEEKFPFPKQKETDTKSIT